MSLFGILEDKQSSADRRCSVTLADSITNGVQNCSYCRPYQHDAGIHLLTRDNVFTARCTTDIAKRGLAIVCRPSVCDVGGSGP